MCVYVYECIRVSECVHVCAHACVYACVSYQQRRILHN